MPPLLAGIKVLDFTTLLPGPYATMMLADLGADVLKVESPDRMDIGRLVPPFVDEDGEISCFHAYINRNKRSLALDLKNPGSFPIIERLIKEQKYNIVIEQFRPGVMNRLGLSYERLQELAPDLIYCSLTGYGQTGASKDRAGHDINYLATSGVMSYSGRKDTGPTLMGIQVADMGAGSNNALIGILAAIIHRMNTGEGNSIDVSMTDGLFPYHAVSGINHLVGGPEPGYETEILNGGSLYGFYETADQRYLSFGGLEPQFFTEFLRVLEIDDAVAANAAVGPGGPIELKDRVTKVIRSRPLDHWAERFEDVEACVEPVLTCSEAVQSVHAKQRGILVDVPAPGGSAVTQVACPIKFTNFKPKYRAIGCRLGRDTGEVLRELRFSEQELEEMRERGVFGDAEVG